MSAIYTQHTITAIFVSQTGHHHVRAYTDEATFYGETPTSIECGACEPYLVKEGWVYDPDLVPLTDRQIANRERLEREGNAAVAKAAEALATSATAVMNRGAAGGVERKRTRRTRAAADE